MGQRDGLGFSEVIVQDLATPASGGIQPGDKVALSAYGGPANRSYIGVKAPWSDLNGPFQICSTDGAGTLSTLLTVPQSAGQGPFLPEGLLISSAVTAAGNNSPFGCSVCAYADPAPPAAAVTPGIDYTVGLVTKSWSSHIPFVDFLSPLTWGQVSYQTIDPITGQPTTVAAVGPCSEGLGVAVSSFVAFLLAAALGGTVTWKVPDQAHFALFYKDPLAVAGSLSAVAWIEAVMPVGPDGTSVMAIALAADIVNAIYYGRFAGIKPAILGCFKPLTS